MKESKNYLRQYKLKRDFQQTDSVKTQIVMP